MLTRTDITVTTDYLGRVVVVIDDDLAVHLRQLSQKGWRDIPDVNYGDSDKVLDGTPDAATLQVILDAVATSAPSEQDRSIARRGSFYGFVVGTSGWDATRRIWRDYSGTRHLHPTGSIVRNRDGWRFAG